MRILVTGAAGFIGRNVISILQLDDSHTVYRFDKDSTIDDLKRFTKDCEFVIHLAGVNRPTNPKDFYEGNAGLTETLCKNLKDNSNKCPILVSSSIQAEKDNDYGKSKKQAEDLLLQHGKDNGNKVYVYRFKNIYGKWSRPNYNSVVATWCYNIARGLSVTIDNPDASVELCYIDDVVDAIVGKLSGKDMSGYYQIEKTNTITLKELYGIIQSFKDSRQTKIYPNQDCYLSRNLYATYLNYLPVDDFSYPLDMHTDQRGSFTEVLRSQTQGQVSINISKPGITKGQHWHSTKSEKFLVVSGTGVIQFRDLFSKEIIEYPVSGDKLKVVDIPTGYVHNLMNTGNTDMVTLIWANELFDANRPDTNYQEV